MYRLDDVISRGSIYILMMLKIIIAGCVSLLILSIYVRCYKYGTTVQLENAASDYKYVKKQICTNFKEGHAIIVIDDYGYNNLYTPKAATVDILIMGSSHVEALQVAANQNLTYCLNENIPDLYTYNVGISAHSLYHCVSNISNMILEFHPTKYIIIETHSVYPNPKQMQEVLDGALVPNKVVSDSLFGTKAFMMIKKYLPAVRALYNGLKDWMNMSVGEEEISGESMTYEQYGVLLNSFLEKASVDVCSDGQSRRLLIFYHPSTAISPDGKLILETEPEYLKLFEETCQANGIVFVDMSEEFVKLYEEKNKLPYGFSNTSVGTGHLNADGHRVIAERLAKVINELEDK